MKLLKEVTNELLLVFRGKTLDVILPPLVFYISYRVFSLNMALVLSIGLSLFYLGLRIAKKDNWVYATIGFFGTVFAVAMVLISNNANNIFLPDLIGTSMLVGVTFVSLICKKPLAAWVSHITRGWNKDWFFLDNVLPAYTEVTIFWLGFFVIRLLIEIVIYSNSSVDTYAIFNIVSGLPVTIIILTLSYIYGIWRLRNLKGPGVDEFEQGKLPPYKGQRKGF